MPLWQKGAEMPRTINAGNSTFTAAPVAELPALKQGGVVGKQRSDLTLAIEQLEVGEFLTVPHTSLNGTRNPHASVAGRSYGVRNKSGRRFSCRRTADGGASVVIRTA